MNSVSMILQTSVCKYLKPMIFKKLVISILAATCSLSCHYYYFTDQT